MLRHIAIDEQNTIVNLYNLDEIDANKHTYFCIACGKEVFVDVDDRGNYSFLHLDENIPCEDDFYLHEAAKKVLCRRFNTQHKFDVQNQGVDIEVGYSKKWNSGFEIGVTGDFAWNKNEIIDANDLNYSSIGYYYPFRKTGYSIGQKFGYLIDYSNGNGFFNSRQEIADRKLVYQGVTPRVGDFIYRDLNSDGLIDERDKAPLDGVKTMPSFMAGASVQMKYKNFDLYIQLQGETGRNAFYDGLGVFENQAQGVYLDIHRNAWTPERYAAGEKIEYPALTSTTSSSLLANEFFVSKANYLRLKNVTLGYSLPDKIVKKMKMNQFRIYITGQNLLSMTDLKFKGFDPESKSIDSFVYRMFNFGLNINF